MHEAVHTSPDPVAAADLRARAAFDQQLWVLGRLAQAGLNMALALEAQAIATHPEAAADQGPQPYGAPKPAPVSLDFLPPEPGELALAFTRVSRAVRMTVALQARLLKGDVGGPNASASRAPAPPPLETRAQRANRAGTIVGRLAAGSDGDAFEAMELMERARERLFDVDITGDLLDRPIPDLIAEICRDLGLSPNWAEVQGEAWMRDGAPSDEPTPRSRARPSACPASASPPATSWASPAGPPGGHKASPGRS
jgi:hypothetical protein